MESFREGAVFELDLEGSIGRGNFPGREGVLGRGSSESQGREAQKSCACSWEEELLIDDLGSWPRDLPKSVRMCVSGGRAGG